MAVCDFLNFFSRNHFLEGASFFNGGVCYSVGGGGGMGVQASEVGHPMEGIDFDGVFQKKT